MPLPSRNAVSKDSASRCAMSGRTLNRSTTASMSCLRLGSSSGAASISYAVPSMRTRTKPCAVRSASTSWCSPLRAATSGASSRQLSPSGKLQHLVHHLADGLRSQVHAVLGAARNAGARIQQAQVVVDLGHRAHGGARIVGGGLLLDRDRRRQAFDAVHVRLVHHRQELPGVRRQRLDVAALPLGIEGVEGQGGFARSGQAGDDDQPVARQVDVDIAQVVGAGTADANEIH